MNKRLLLSGCLSAFLATCNICSINAASGYTGPSTDGTGAGAYYTGVYRNLFVDILGKSESEVQAKVDQVWKHFFTPGSPTAVYYETDDNMAYIYDVGNGDVRTEGQSYGMMITVQLDHQQEFDKLWRWAKKYMQHEGGEWDGYFAWQCKTSGEKIDNTCAPDGEEYFITALFFASNCWGNDGDIDYNAEAQYILKKIMDKKGVGGVNNMFNPSNHTVVFAPNWDNINFGDPSYCLPGFMELWARWTESNKDFWAQTAEAARKLLRLSCNSESGLFPDYCQFDGTPYRPEWQGYDTKQYKYDAIRCAMNVGMDYNWFRTDSVNQTAMMTRLLSFFQKDGYNHGYFDWDGQNPSGNYNEGVAGTNGVACFAVNDEALTKRALEIFWNTQAPTGQWRYYNGMVYFLSLLNASGNFKIYKPMPTENSAKVTESTKNDFLLTPNPTDSKVKIVSNEPIIKADVYDIDGKLVNTTTYETIDMTELKKGCYLVKVQTKDSNAKVAKLTKN